MLRLWAVAALVALTACQSAPPPDCAVVSSRASDCFKRFEGTHDDRKMLLACFPFSEAQKISGAWIVGFELNAFYEGTKASPDLVKFVSTPSRHPSNAKLSDDATLVMGPEMGPRIPDDGKARVFQIGFVGRKEKCPILPPGHTIIVDKVLSAPLRGVG